MVVCSLKHRGYVHEKKNEISYVASPPLACGSPVASPHPLAGRRTHRELDREIREPLVSLVRLLQPRVPLSHTEHDLSERATDSFLETPGRNFEQAAGAKISHLSTDKFAADPSLGHVRFPFFSFASHRSPGHRSDDLAREATRTLKS